ncbi:GNAT family N-acetyltransferase [Hymenobacter sp. GOD-10R]|uniref:GNAT family N-acetyltransferase n=1 Tax=Hymenobacter sp. GOD-10R TaxID=3093922 RepID=UPI002D79A065|nr:GNAT family N-acetyltransferase [Hymenobacter sp. GOD-10R]WRQ26738.1 GNAT family N-acetyltransferase [Hymenobacter sp. GOD-10R]
MSSPLGLAADSYTLRLATPDDAAAMLAIYTPYITDTTITLEYEVPTTAEFAERVRKLQGVLPWLVAEAEGQVVGYAYAARHRERAAYLWSVETSVYVHITHHGTGVARRLYNWLFELLQRQGYVNAYAGVIKPNPRSFAFHQSLGFELIGTYEHVAYKFGKWQTSQWLAKQLQTPPLVPVPPTPLAELQLP